MLVYVKIVKVGTLVGWVGCVDGKEEVLGQMGNFQCGNNAYMTR